MMTDGRKDGEGDKKGRSRLRSNQIIALTCFGMFAGMIGLAYAAVPLYRAFCQVTGYGGTTRRATQGASHVLDRRIEVRFDANTRDGLDWDFHPAQRSIEMKIGETREIHYTAHNKLDVPARGRALFNVTPEWTGAYFNKIQCFCFSDLTLKPGETRDLPVVFFVDPAIVKASEAKGLTTITLSYSMFPIDSTKTSSVGKNQISVSETGSQKETTNSATHIGG
jgi:cytochrome c oxidase assembly protein subunit 11